MILFSVSTDNSTTLESTDFCVINKIPENGYVKEALTDNQHMLNDIVNHTQHVLYYCNKNFERFGQNRIRCYAGRWQGRTPVCKALCDTRELVSDSFEISTCAYGEGLFDCRNMTQARAGTIAKLSCKLFYINAEGQEDQVVMCDDDGQWSPVPTPCPEDEGVEIGGGESDLKC